MQILKGLIPIFHKVKVCFFYVPVLSSRAEWINVRRHLLPLEGTVIAHWKALSRKWLELNCPLGKLCSLIGNCWGLVRGLHPQNQGGWLLRKKHVWFSANLQHQCLCIFRCTCTDENTLRHTYVYSQVHLNTYIGACSLSAPLSHTQWLWWHTHYQG